MKIYHRSLIAIMAVVLFICMCPGLAVAAGQKGFETPEKAVSTFISAMKSKDMQGLMGIFGEAGEDLIYSGDPVSDKQRFEMFVAAYDAKTSIARDGDTAVLIVGEADWPFPIPLVKEKGLWIFAVESGKEEILNRRVGENELNTIQTLLAVVDAQREYAMHDHDNDNLLEYAEKFQSDPGKKNGLYWKTEPDEKPSPLGELMAQAWSEGYTFDGSHAGPRPFHGYYFKMLTGQGANAPGGEFDYIVNGNMIGGFALIAHPATYGNSGIMTFIVNHRGMVYEKDLGEDTENKIKKITAFDPDEIWQPVMNETDERNMKGKNQ
ncbi:MAG TPA: DUF2950 domain-containing protein [Desulfotignum sp.]|nr:DUF2950 domain-containing protein [Desulfotignum sp.]